MSNKTQLQTNNSALDALITRVNAAKDTAASLPDAGGGSGSGGSSIETCTVEIFSDNAIEGYCYSYVENGLITSAYMSALDSASVVLNHVVCGSYVTLSLIYSQMIEQNIGANVLNNAMNWHIIANAGETATIKLISP